MADTPTPAAPPAPAAPTATPPRPSSAAPETLDQVTETTTPHGWWALWGIAATVLIALVWSIVASIPQQVSATGVVSSFNYSYAVTAPIAGTIDFTDAVSGALEPDASVATITPYGGGTPVDVLAGRSGKLGSVLVPDGSGVEPGMTVATVIENPDASEGIVVVTYVPASEALTYFAGQSAEATITDLALSTTTVVKATIVDVANSPSSLEGMENASGSQSLAQQWLNESDGTPYRILLKMTDWPTDGSVPVPASGEVVSLVNTYGSIHPIELLFGGK